MEAALYFGSFNPPHCGHAAIAGHLYRKAGFGEVWMVLSPQNPFKEKQPSAAEALRLSMMRAWVAEVPYLRLCTLEFEMERPSYTYLTLRRLRDSEPERHFAVVMGADSLAAFPRWREAAEIAQCHPSVVYPREGYDCIRLAAEVRQQLPQADIRCLEAPLFPYSSTAIRAAVAAGEDVSGMVPPAVWQFIRRNNLYVESH